MRGNLKIQLSYELLALTLLRNVLPLQDTAANGGAPHFPGVVMDERETIDQFRSNS